MHSYAAAVLSAKTYIQLKLSFKTIVPEHDKYLYLNASQGYLKPVLTEYRKNYFNHGRSLVVGQFLNAPLSLHDLANLQRQVGVLLFLSNLQTWKKRVPES